MIAAGCVVLEGCCAWDLVPQIPHAPCPAALDIRGRRRAGHSRADRGIYSESRRFRVFRCVRGFGSARADRAINSPARCRYSGVSRGAIFSRSGNSVAATPLTALDDRFPVRILPGMILAAASWPVQQETNGRLFDAVPSGTESKLGARREGGAGELSRNNSGHGARQISWKRRRHAFRSSIAGSCPFLTSAAVR